MNENKDPTERGQLLSPEEAAPKIRQHLEERDKKIIEAYLSGGTREQIASLFGFNVKVVASVVRKHGLDALVRDREQKLIQATLKQKIPVLQEIVHLSLGAVKDWLEETLGDEELKKERLSRVRDIKALTSMSKELNEMLRLELGQSTANVRHDVEFSLAQTKQVLTGLRERDKVFDYPVIEEEEDGEEIIS